MKNLHTELATNLGLTLKQYYIKNITKWQTTLDNLAVAQSYTNKSAVGSSINMDRVSIKEAEAQLKKWQNYYKKEFGLDDTPTGGSAKTIRVRTV